MFDLLGKNDFLSYSRRWEETGQLSEGRSTGQLDCTWCVCGGGEPVHLLLQQQKLSHVFP